MKGVKPLPATTIILLRSIGNDTKNIEVLMTKRQNYLKFLGGYYVFPGGKVEEQDYSDVNLSRVKGISQKDARKILKIKNNNDDKISLEFNYLGYWTAGIRELFEEIGILLATNKFNDPIPFQSVEKFKDYRFKIINNEITMYEMMVKEDLYYSAEMLTYYNRFITPKFSPKRFDTRFFICKFPGEQIKIDPYEKEISELIWIKPNDALNRIQKKDPNFKLIFPQIASLKDLEYFDLNLLI